MAKEIVKEFQDKHFGKLDKAVSPDKIKEDKAYLLRVLRSGIELESANIPYESKLRLQQALKCDGNYNELNGWVERVYGDGSINPQGWEIVFKGSSECFDSYYRALSETERIIKSFARGRVNNYSTSAHITLLTSQNRELPQAYLANYYQLFRKFTDAILWLAGSGYNDGMMVQGIVRGHLGQYASPNMRMSPFSTDINEIARAQNKYTAMYFKHDDGDNCFQRWMANGNPNGVCVEFRFVDRITIPIALTSVKCLLQAMLFKAVELSEFGILNIEAAGIDEWEKTKTMTAKIANGGTMTATDKAYLTKKALNLVDFISPSLRSFDGKSISVLRSLAEKPISMRYIDSDSDEKIERDLLPKEKSEFKTERELRRIIQLQLVKAEGAGEWGKKVADILGVSERMVRHSLAKLGEDYNIQFDKDIGGFVVVG